MIFTAIDIKEFFSILSKTMNTNRSYLSDLDSIVGDGDLGITMGDGFSAAASTTTESSETDIGKLLYVAGKSISSAAPSTMGTLMASGILCAAKALRGSTQIGLEGIVLLMKAWLEGAANLGKAKRGEKTFLDGLAPAVDILVAANAVTDDPIVVIAKAAIAATQGAQDTVGMLAVHGRATIRGEGSRSILDPGAVVASLIMKSLSETVQKKSGQLN